MKRKVLLCLSAFLLSAALIYTDSMDVKAEDITSISLGSTITVNGSAINTDANSAVYVSTKVEAHSAVSAKNSSLENTVVHITNAGTYSISGSLTNGQILVDASVAPNVRLIFDSVNITNQTAPAVIITDSSYTPQTTAANTVTIELDGENSLTGSHIPKNTEDYNNIKYDGALSSDVSLDITGSGTLNINGDKEGIETKENLVIDSGSLNVTSMDDAINACTDNISCITINGGTVYVNISSEGEEGDGIDSNGYITINGGTVYAYAHPSSPDGGLDSDLGVTINNGTVIASGCNIEAISTTSAQSSLLQTFSSLQEASTLICITDSDGSPVMAWQSAKTYQAVLYSSPLLSGNTDNYKLYVGGTITGTCIHGLYTDITSYTGGTLTDWTSGGMGGGQPGGTPPNETIPPDGSRPSSFQAGYYSLPVTINSDGSIVCYNENQELIKNAFVYDGTYTYFMKDDGTAMKDYLTYDPEGTGVIYFDSDGHMAFNSFVYCNTVGYTCYFGGDGRAYFDQITFANGNTYYLDGTGKLQCNGWFQFANGLDYGYANGDGSLITSCFSTDSQGRTVYYHWNGMVARGLITDGVWYYDMDTTDGHWLGQFKA